MIAPAIVRLIASFAVSIIQTFSDSPPNTRWLREANIPIPTPIARPTSEPSVIEKSALLLVAS